MSLFQPAPGHYPTCIAKQFQSLTLQFIVAPALLAPCARPGTPASMHRLRNQFSEPSRGERLSVGGFDTMVIRIKAQVAFGRPVGAVEIGSGKSHVPHAGVPMISIIWR
jgi:hypothetical protein